MSLPSTATLQTSRVQSLGRAAFVPINWDWQCVELEFLHVPIQEPAEYSGKERKRNPKTTLCSKGSFWFVSDCAAESQSCGSLMAGKDP